jgi:hypothetical protein
MYRKYVPDLQLSLVTTTTTTTITTTTTALSQVPADKFLLLPKKLRRLAVYIVDPLQVYGLFDRLDGRGKNLERLSLSADHDFEVSRRIYFRSNAGMRKIIQPKELRLSGLNLSALYEPLIKLIDLHALESLTIIACTGVEEFM